MPGFMIYLVTGSEEITATHTEKRGEGGPHALTETQQQPGSPALFLLLDKKEVQVASTHPLKTSSTP